MTTSEAILEQIQQLRKALLMPRGTAILMVDSACCELFRIAAEIENCERATGAVLSTIGGNPQESEPATDDFSEVIMIGQP